MHDVLSDKHVQQRGIFNLNTIQAMLKQPNHYFTSSGISKLWQVGLLEYWLQQHGL